MREYLMGGITILFILFPMTSMAINTLSQTLTINATELAPTCFLSVGSGASGGTKNLGVVDAGDFASNATVDKGNGALLLALTNCQGIPGNSLRPTIIITGDTDGLGDPSLYRSADSTSTGVGVILRYCATDMSSGSQITNASAPLFWDLTDERQENGCSIYSADTLPQDNSSIPLYMAMSRGTGPYSGVHSGTLKAKLHFQFEWH
ncbi:P pilus assembly protein, pilin FimA [Serratia fonticola]|jgi:type 1 fimbria pilin|uniref:hypothetical protein n=1 Tax=Serratia fonticola TaxID=47917 RepID=UPI002177A10B|nr:hypothetical protein [Serratia fonticola]CAI1750360.1 P pilus assembly protein, pilin FimA [Serratia fonticola]